MNVRLSNAAAAESILQLSLYGQRLLSVAASLLRQIKSIRDKLASSRLPMSVIQGERKIFEKKTWCDRVSVKTSSNLRKKAFSMETHLRATGVNCHTGSLICHPTQVNASRLNPSQPGRYSIYLPRRDGRLS